MFTPARGVEGSGWGPKSGLAATISALVVMGSATRPRILRESERDVSMKSVARATHFIARVASAVIIIRRLWAGAVTSSTMVRNLGKMLAAQALALIIACSASASNPGSTSSGEDHWFNVWLGAFLRRQLVAPSSWAGRIMPKSSGSEVTIASVSRLPGRPLLVTPVEIPRER